MSKIEGAQNIPALLLDLYRGTIGRGRNSQYIRKRHPFKLPPMQEGGKNVRPSQTAQRTRFKLAKEKFKTLSSAARARWYSAEPEWNSFLWYYNYFIMSSLSGNANIEQGGAGVIKSIQFVDDTVPTTGGKVFSISTVDPTKTVVMMFGNSYISDTVQRGTISVPDGSTANDSLSPSIDPDIAEVHLSPEAGYMYLDDGTGSLTINPFYLSALSSSQITVGLQSISKGGNLTCSYEIIEHKSQTVYPIIEAIAASSVTIDWANTPSVSAKVSLIVIEYI